MKERACVSFSFIILNYRGATTCGYLSTSSSNYNKLIGKYVSKSATVANEIFATSVKMVIIINGVCMCVCDGKDTKGFHPLLGRITRTRGRKENIFQGKTLLFLTLCRRL